MKRRNLLKTLGSGTIVATAGCVEKIKSHIPGASSIDYPTKPRNIFQNDVGRTGYFPDKKLKTHGEEKWSIEMNSTYMAKYVPTPLVDDDGVVAISDSGRIYMVTTEGEIVDRTMIKGAVTVRSTPSIAGGIIYVGSFDDGVFAISRKSGEILWNNTSIWRSASSPLYYDGNIYIQGVENSESKTPILVKIDAKTGENKWKISLGGLTKSSPLYDEQNSQIIVGNKDGIVAVDSETGSTNWSAAENRVFKATPSLANGTVVCSGNDGEVVALDSGTGDELWARTIGGHLYAAPAIDKGEQLAYIGSSNGAFAALNVKNGSVEWSHNNNYRVVTPPTVCSNALVYNEWREVKFVNKRTGEVMARHKSDKNQIFTTHEIHNGHIYIAESESLENGFLGDYKQGRLKKI